MADKVILEAEIKSNVGEVAKGIDTLRRSWSLLAFNAAVCEAAPDKFFNNPESDRTKLFLSQILSH